MVVGIMDETEVVVVVAADEVVVVVVVVVVEAVVIGRLAWEAGKFQTIEGGCPVTNGGGCVPNTDT